MSVPMHGSTILPPAFVAAAPALSFVAKPVAIPVPAVPMPVASTAPVATQPTGLAIRRFAGWQGIRDMVLRCVGRYTPCVETLDDRPPSVQVGLVLAPAAAEGPRVAPLARAAVAAPTASVALRESSSDLVAREARLTAQNGGVPVYIVTPHPRDLDPRLDFDTGVVAVIHRMHGDQRVIERRMSASGTQKTLMLPDDIRCVHILPIAVHRDGGYIIAVTTTA